MASDQRSWHHRPAHIFEDNTMYLVTGATLHKRHIFFQTDRLHLLQSALFQIVDAYGWKLQAWAIFANHYHFIAQSPVDAKALGPMIQRLHSQTARQVNRLDGAIGRKVWFQYWDTCITYEKSYFVRLNYVHNNPVKHGLVSLAEHYPFCSAEWFRDHVEPSFRRKVESFRYDNLSIEDEF